MHRLRIAATVAIFTLGFATSANAQVQKCGQDNRAAGTVIGAVVGGAAGGAIANNTRRSFRGSRGFRGQRGFRGGGRGFRGGGRGFRGGRSFRRSRRGNQGLGIVLGALAGGVVGNQIAAANTRDCHTVVRRRGFNDPYANQHGQHNNHTLVGGDIDYTAKRLGDPYGGRRVITSQPGVAPLQPRPAPTPFSQSTPAQGVFQPRCQTVFRITEFPDGRRDRQPVEVCQFSQGGEWIPR